MFSTLLTDLVAELDTLKHVLVANDRVRSLVFPVTPVDAATGGVPSTGFAIAGIEWPNRIDWQVFDHCAAFTRLYAIFEQFVTDLIEEYLAHLPLLYPKYADLPESVRTQHRVAVGQILLKWSEDGPYKHLTEMSILSGLKNGIAGASNYSLLPDAFQMERDNYRAGVLKKLFACLGFSDCWSAVSKDPRMIKFIEDRRDTTETADTILKDIVEYRNEGSHTKISNVVSIEEIRSYIDFIGIVCAALHDMLKIALLRRCLEQKHAVLVGRVLKVFGRAIGIQLEPGFVMVAEELILVNNNSVAWATVESIQKLNQPHTRFETTTGEELGLVLTGRAKSGMELYRLTYTKTAGQPA